jgi:hypothetical protein
VDEEILLEDLPTNAGEFSISRLLANDIPFVGTEGGINSIMNTPVGDEAMEIVSDIKMRAYGWCFKVNGVEPDTFADKIEIKTNDTTVYWFFGYAEYDSGEWVTYCDPTHIHKPDFICANR